MMLDEIRFWIQVIGDSQRTVFCSPGNESRVKSLVDAYGVGGIFTVRVSPAIPDDQVYIVDEEALEAANRQAVQQLVRRP